MGIVVVRQQSAVKKAGSPLVPDKPVLDAVGDRFLGVGRGVSRFPAQYAEECRVAQRQ